MDACVITMNGRRLITSTNGILAFKTGLIVFSAITLFFQDLFMIFSDAVQNETTSYLLIIPFLLVYLVYRKRKMINAAIRLESSRLLHRIPVNELIGVLLLLSSITLYWYGSYTFTPLEYHLLALPLYVLACVLLLFNTQTLRQLAFPMVFLFLLVPPPADILYNVGTVLSSVSSEAAYSILTLFRLPATLSYEEGTPTIFLTQQSGASIQLAVDVACSGIYSLLGFFIFALFMVFLIRDKPWKKAVVFAVGFPLIYLANVLRITSIGVIGYYYGETLALDLFHLLGGWVLIFGTTIVLLLASEKILKISITGRRKQVCEDCKKMPAPTKFCQSCGRILSFDAVKFRRKDLLKVVGIIGVVILLVSIQTPVFALTQGPPEIILQSPKGGSEATSILPAIANYSLRFVYRDKGFENVSGQDASVVYAYFPEYPYNETKESIWVAIEVASDISSLHRWETCLITWPMLQGHQPRVIQIELNDTQIVDNPPIIGRFFIFNRTANYELQAVLYWYESAVFTIDGTALQKQVKISLEAYPATLDDIPKIKGQLLEFATKIAGYWQPLKVWSQWSLFLSQNGDIFAILALGMTALVAGMYFYGTRVEKKRSTVAFKKLSDLDKLIVTSIYAVKKPDSPTLTKILANCDDGKGTAVGREILLDRLTVLEKLGIVRSEIASDKDEPLHVWRANVFS